jgi:two-component system, LytTR family, response regulator LytT
VKIVIIEDEQLTANDLAKTIRKINPDINIVTFLYSVEDAIVWFKQNEHPDLIFSDIQLGDGLCFDIFKTIEIKSPIVFCTAYDEYALTAFRTNGIDYILKPFDEESVNNALRKYSELEKRFSAKKNQLEDLFESFENRESPKKGSILVYYKDKILPVKITNIALFYIENEITYLITFGQEKFTINESLDELESMVGHDFFRANRQYLIQRKAVKEAANYFLRSLSVTLTIPLKETIKVNKVKVPNFLNWLSIN